MRTVGVWMVAAASALLGAPAGAKPGPKPDVVALSFAWPATFGAQVTYRWTRTSTGKPAQGVTVVGRVTVAADGENLRVEFRDWKREPAGASPADALSLGPEGMAFVVDKKGGLVRVDGAVPALAKELASRTWQMLVGRWAGVELPLGREYQTIAEGPTSLAPGGKLRTPLRFRAERLLDCPGNPAARCVELKLRSEPDRKSMARLVNAVASQSAAKDDLKSSDVVGAVEEAILVTEPAGLIPHRLAVTKTVELRGSPEDPQGRSQVDRTTWTYDYPLPSGKPASQ